MVDAKFFPSCFEYKSTKSFVVGAYNFLIKAGWESRPSSILPMFLIANSTAQDLDDTFAGELILLK